MKECERAGALCPEALGMLCLQPAVSFSFAKQTSQSPARTAPPAPHCVSLPCPSSSGKSADSGPEGPGLISLQIPDTAQQGQGVRV